MPVQQRDSAKGGPAAEAGAPAGWLKKLNDVGERHATAIIAVSTGLIILTVLLFAKGAYDRSQIERAEQEFTKAGTAEQLAALKTKFGATPAAPRILYRLANRYADDGKLESAQNEYREFLKRFPQDPLEPRVSLALQTVERNLAFERERKPLLAKAEGLQSHPLQLPRAKDTRLEFGPRHEPNPVAELEVGTGTVKIELLEDEAPYAVASFVALCEKKAFDGLALDFVGGDERLQVLPKADAPEALLGYEAPLRPAEAGSLVLVKKGTENRAGAFQILLRPVTDLKDVTVFGFIQDTGLPILRSVKKDDRVKSLKVVSKRSHAYDSKGP